MARLVRANRHSLISAVALGVLISVGTAWSAAEVAADDRLAIDFEAITIAGKPFNGLDHSGKVVLLDFWAVWCRPCMEAFPRLNTLSNELADKNFEVVGVAVHSGAWEEVAEFLQGYDVQYTVVVPDEALVYRHCVIGVPTYLLIDTHGAVYKRYVGEQPELIDRVTRDVGRLLELSQAP